jgi:uncharacterized protein
MTRRDQIEPGTVAWVDLQTPDLDQARRFYGALLGWSFAAPSGLYVLAQRGGRSVAGLVKLRPATTFPPAWTVYFAADDVDAWAREVRTAGGQVVVPPTDVTDQGRMAYFADPTGAHFGAWQAGAHRGAEVTDEVGAMTWHEVYTRDAARARTFYTGVLGAEAVRLDAPDVEYYTLRRDGRTVCGLMQMTDQFPKEVPSHWNTYFAVGDADAAARSVTSLGGAVLAPPFDTPYGRMLVAADPAGASFCLIVPVSPSQSW